MKSTIVIIISTLFGQIMFAQESNEVRKYDLLPIITYSAESALNLGVIGFRYFDLGKENKDIPVSFLNMSAIYTTRNQMYLESGYQFFLSNGNRIEGRLYYFDAPDRNYGLGNNPNLLLTQNETNEILNYLDIDVARIGFQGSYQKKVGKNLFLGFGANIENVSKYDTIPSSFQIIQGAEKLNLLQNRVKGKRIGLGLILTSDTRDQVINARKGHFIRLSFLANSKIFGSDFEYHASRVEFTKYINPYKNHTLAFRFIQDWKHPFGSTGSIPLYGLSRPDGRGYFRGTFQDRHSQQIDIEYRLPFWRDGNLGYSKLHFWKGLGMVFFVNGQQAYGEMGSYDISNTNVALGSGLRVLFNKKNRMNLRIDFAYGLLENGNGINSRQTTFSFNLSEAF
nr:BamA/TamA family outer membrane protein [Allomuricauda sp.]